MKQKKKTKTSKQNKQALYQQIIKKDTLLIVPVIWVYDSVKYEN